MKKERKKDPRNFRYLRYTLLFLCCFGLLRWTDTREKEANDPGVAVHNAEVRRYESIVNSVQHVPPMKLEDVDPSKPVYFKGTLQARSGETIIDDPLFGVSFGDAIGARRVMAYGTPENQKPEQLPEGLPSELIDLPDRDIILETLVPADGVELLTYECPPRLLGQLFSTKKSKQRDKWPPKLESAVGQPEVYLAKSDLRALKTKHTWEQREDKNKRKYHRLTVTVGEEPAVAFNAAYTWLYPLEVHYLGGVADGKLVPFKGIGRDREDVPFMDSLYFIDTKAIKVRDTIEYLKQGFGFVQFNDPLGNRVIETPTAPLSYARGTAEIGSIVLAAVCFFLFLFAPGAHNKKETREPPA